MVDKCKIYKMVAVAALLSRLDANPGETQNKESLSALRTSPLDIVDYEQIEPDIGGILAIIEHGTLLQKADLIDRVKEDGSIDWIHLLLYDETEARFLALKAISEVGTYESVPHLFNFIERTYERHNSNETQIILNPDQRAFQAQGIAVAVVEKLIGEPILDPSLDSLGASRTFLEFLTTNGYEDEMKRAILKADAILHDYSLSPRAKGENETPKPEPSTSDEAPISGKKYNSDSRVFEEETSNNGTFPVWIWVLVCGVLLSIVFYILQQKNRSAN